MPTVLQFRRGTTAQNNSHTGSAGEISIDTTLDTIRVHDGSTAGGFEITSNAATQTLTNKTLTSPVLNTGVSGTAVLDEDNMASDSDTKLATQQSIKAYVDAEDAAIASDTLTLTNKTFDANGTGNSITNIDSGNFLSGFFLDEDNMASDDATAVASQQSIKAYVDAQVTAQDLDFQGDSGGALSIDLDSETLDIAGGTGIDTSGSGNTLTVAIDSTVTTLTGTQTLTNKTLTTPVISSI